MSNYTGNPLRKQEPTQSHSGQLLTVHQAADALAVSPNTVRNLIRSDELPAVRVGPRLVRIKQGDLDAFLKPYEGGQAGQWAHL